MIVVRTESIRLPECIRLNEEEMDVFNRFKQISKVEEDRRGDFTKCLCLVPFDESQPLGYLLEEGMYDYYSTNPMAQKMFGILYDLSAKARPISYVESDILAVID